MSFLSPLSALIAAGITIPLLVALYFLKLRRRPMVVPSTLLWRKAVQDLQVNAPFQKLRNSLLLWLQLLLLALLLLAMARPADDAAAVTGDRVAILIDHSASMSATDAPGNASRLEEAKRRARDVVANLDGGAAAMVVSFAEASRVRQQFTTDRAALRRAIDAIEPTDQPGRLGPALRVLEPHAATADTGALSVVVIGDGKVSDGAGVLPGVPGAEVRFLAIGSATPDNLAIVAADARRGVDDPAAVEVFVRLINTGPDTLTTAVTLQRDGEPITVRKVAVPGATDRTDTTGDEGVEPASTVVPGERVVTFPLRIAGGAALEVSHDHDDALSADNTARMVLTAAKRLRALIVSPDAQPFALVEAVGATGVDVMDRVTPAQFDEQDMTGENYDVVVFDRWTPDAPPVTNTLCFGVVPAIPGLALREAQEDDPPLQRPLTWATDEPVMRYVSLDELVVRRPGRLVLPTGGRSLAMGLTGPMIAQVPYQAEDGRRTEHVIVSFPVNESRWPLSWSYQVFMVNALEVLGLDTPGDSATLKFAPGEAVSVPVESDAGAVVFSGPVELRGNVRGGQATLPTLSRVGWYEAGDGVEPPFTQLAVNLLDVNESDLRPAATLRVASSSGTAASAAEGEERVRREWWPWVLSAALGMLCVEWFVYVRRMRV